MPRNKSDFEKVSAATGVGATASAPPHPGRLQSGLGRYVLGVPPPG